MLIGNNNVLNQDHLIHLHGLHHLLLVLGMFPTSDRLVYHNLYIELELSKFHLITILKTQKLMNFFWYHFFSLILKYKLCLKRHERLLKSNHRYDFCCVEFYIQHSKITLTVRFLSFCSRITLTIRFRLFFSSNICN